MLRAKIVLAVGLLILAGLGLHALTAGVLIVLIIVAALCWVIVDTGRSRRLAMLIRAWRGKGRP